MSFDMDGLRVLSQRVYDELDKFRVRCDVEPELRDDFPAVRLIIQWGDWKHEHARAKWICREMGGIVVSSEVTEEDGSDTYSADHVVVFPLGWRGLKPVEV